MSDTHMNGPGVHEYNAMNCIQDDHLVEAQVSALLAIAAAVNRLADAVESMSQ